MFISFFAVPHHRERARKKKEEEEKRMEREREKVSYWSFSVRINFCSILLNSLPANEHAYDLSSTVIAVQVSKVILLVV